ncbi:MAG: lantibiotic immunity ABC transporter MutG family permease subunit [Peptoniphilus sp.]|nr:lantibiotic immunity ABC transporter MutG family permease subunit [Peptoniphilus sp.]MDY3119045.1 lantibiotic immunity ABC transporter MutG family permease subunit [Peptoniphilus sp.]
MGRVIRSELYRVKHTWIPWIHIVLPMFYALVFFLASRLTGLKNFAPDDTIQAYFALFGAAVPSLCGVLTSKVVDMESGAGSFQALLATIPSRTKAYLGKEAALLLGFLLSASVAVVLFGCLFGQRGAGFWGAALFFLLCGVPAVYCMHLWVALALGSGPSIGLGFVETLIAFLAMTGLGDKFWYFLPCTWPARLPGTYIVGSAWQDPSLLTGELAKWSFAALPITAMVVFGSLVWFRRWDGKTWSD